MRSPPFHNSNAKPTSQRRTSSNTVVTEQNQDINVGKRECCVDWGGEGIKGCEGDKRGRDDNNQNVLFVCVKLSNRKYQNFESGLHAYYMSPSSASSWQEQRYYLGSTKCILHTTFLI